MHDRHCVPEDPCLPCRADSDSYASPASADRVALERIARHLLIDTAFHSPAATMLGLIDAALDAGWRPPARVIEDPNELDVSPVGTVLRTEQSRIVLKLDHYGAPDANGFHSEWVEATDEDPSYTIGSGELDDLPATVLYQPEVSADA